MPGSSIFSKTRRVTALVIRAIKNILLKKKIKGRISVLELHHAEETIDQDDTGMNGRDR